ncbi:MAG: GNAT family N-acetyltransferase [Gammaproteobacteria bacterium]|nr:GNAT family N-acetyltransferase [Gammaproteobacteria bacterium]
MIDTVVDAGDAEQRGYCEHAFPGSRHRDWREQRGIAADAGLRLLHASGMVGKGTWIVDHLHETDLLELFNAAHRGNLEIGVADVFVREYQKGVRDFAWHEKYVIAIAARCGLECSEQRWASEQRVAAALLYFRPVREPRWRLRFPREADYAAIAELFHRVFGHELAEEVWRWKYLAGRGMAVVVERDGRMLAHYAGIGRRLRFLGRDDQGIQICDVMVDASERGVMSRQGAFCLATTTFAESFCGYGLKYVTAFGFPTGRHMKLGALLKIYGRLGRMREFEWPCATARPRLTTRVRPYDAQADAAMADRVWEIMAHALEESVVGVRDAEHLRQRYLEHPAQAYQLFVVQGRFGGDPRAIIVLRQAESRCELVDVVASPKDIPLALAQARGVAARMGAAALFCWITDAFAHCFDSPQRIERDLDIVNPTNIWTYGPELSEHQGKWWLMSGDTDFR